MRVGGQYANLLVLGDDVMAIACHAGAEADTLLASIVLHVLTNNATL